MFTFVHVSTTSVKSADVKLASNQRYELDASGSPAKTPKGEYTIISTAKLSVPQTMLELASLDGPSTEISLGGKTVSVPEPVYDYIVGRKLRANQDMQSALKDGGKVARRGDTMSWVASLGGDKMAWVTTHVIASTRSRDAAKSWNDLLDSIGEKLAAGDEAGAKALIA